MVQLKDRGVPLGVFYRKGGVSMREMENFNLGDGIDKTETRTNLRRLDDYLSADQIQWVLETAPAVVVDNNIISGTPNRKCFSGKLMHIKLDGSIPIIDYLVVSRWIRVFDHRKTKPRMGDWYDHLAMISIMLEKDKKEFQRKLKNER